MRSALKIAVLIGILLVTWSAVFASTFSYPFHWDDFHLIRQYSGTEMLSVFHGVVDPDRLAHLSGTVGDGPLGAGIGAVTLAGVLVAEPIATALGSEAVAAIMRSMRGS